MQFLQKSGASDLAYREINGGFYNYCKMQNLQNLHFLQFCKISGPQLLGTSEILGGLEGSGKFYKIFAKICKILAGVWEAGAWEGQKLHVVRR